MYINLEVWQYFHIKTTLTIGLTLPRGHVEEFSSVDECSMFFVRWFSPVPPSKLAYLNNSEKLRKNMIWATTWQNQQNGCVPSEDTDQPGHPPSLVRVFTVHMKEASILSYPSSAEQRLWSDWAHIHFVGFVMRQLISAFAWLFKDIETCCSIMLIF